MKRHPQARKLKRTSPVTQQSRAGSAGSPSPLVSHRETTFRVNGLEQSVSVDVRITLVDMLREKLGLTGTHVGCEHGVCGACTILLNGDAVRSCLIFAVQADGADIMTVEGLGTPDRLHPLQEAFREHHGLQCGFCTPGVLMSALAFLRSTPQPTDEEIRQALAGNLCRCTGYQGILEAVRAAAPRMRGQEDEPKPPAAHAPR